jgi:hypothetical protein
MSDLQNNPPQPFVVIDPYQFHGDIAFGVWDDSLKRYRLGDGDCYNAEELEHSWSGEYTLLTWAELETRLRRPNTKLTEAGSNDERKH